MKSKSIREQLQLVEDTALMRVKIETEYMKDHQHTDSIARFHAECTTSKSRN